MQHRLILSVLFAATTAPVLTAQLPTELNDFDGGSGDRAGWHASRAGFVDADAIPDLIVGAPRADVNGGSSGSAHVISGATGLVIHSVHGDSSSDQLGRFVGCVGDVDGDGRDEFIVGAPFDDGVGSNSGMARVYDGATGDELYSVFGDAAVDEFGIAVAGAGDVNGDGLPDVIVGAHQDALGSGYARIFNGATGGVIRTLSGITDDSSFGRSVAGLGDLDGDGFGEVVVGAFVDSTVGINRGRAYVFAGSTGALMHTFQGNKDHDWFGWSVANLGDLDGDGLNDIGVGAYGVDAGADAAGRAYAYSSADWSLISTVDGGFVNENLGWRLDGTGDVNGDGFGDYIVGAPFEVEGRALLVSGPDGSVIQEIKGSASGDIFGRSVLGLRGDVNGDGWPDVAVGAALDDDNGSSSGSVTIFSGFQPWEDLGHPLAGTGGLEPLFTGQGTLIASETTTLTLTNALPGSTTNIILGLSQLDAPFRGGVLVPSPDFLLNGLLGLPVNGSGEFSFPFAWPAGVPSGFAVYLQHWVSDPGGPVSFAASNGLSGTAP